MNFNKFKNVLVGSLVIFICFPKCYAQNNDFSKLEMELLKQYELDKKHVDTMIILKKLKIRNIEESELSRSIDSVRYSIGLKIWSLGIYLLSSSKNDNYAILEIDKFGDDWTEPPLTVKKIFHAPNKTIPTTSFYTNNEDLEHICIRLKFANKKEGKAVVIITQFPRTLELEQKLTR